MSKGNHITITGDLGSGKSTVAKTLCKLLNYKYLSTGAIQRKLAREIGMNTLELNRYSVMNKEIDDHIDNELKKLNKVNVSHVLDSRLGWHFVNNSYKIYLTALPKIAAIRVSKDTKREDEPKSDDLKKVLNDLSERRTSENRRFKNIYGINCDNLRNYNLVVDSSHASVNEISQLIRGEYKRWKSVQSDNIAWLSPKRIYPTEHVRSLARNEAKEIRQSITENGFEREYTIQVVMFQNDFFVLDGHKRLSGSLFNEISLIPAEIVAANEEELHIGHQVSKFVESSFNISWLYDWEDVHKFRFSHYPERYLKTSKSKLKNYHDC